MKSMLVIGLGRFGHHLVEDLIKYDNQVMIIDKKEEQLEDLVSRVTSAKIGDCTNENVLKTLGIKTFDVVFVCIDSDFQCSLEITNLVKEMGAKKVISKANRDIQEKFLLKNGADEVIYPDRDMAERLARRISSDKIFSYTEIDGDHGIYEIAPMQECIGKSIREVNFRAKYNMSILGTKKENAAAPNYMPGPDHVFKKDEHLIVMAARKDIDKVLKK